MRWRLHVERMLMWHHVDVDSVHVERIAPSGDQLLKNVRFGVTLHIRLQVIDR